MTSPLTDRHPAGKSSTSVEAFEGQGSKRVSDQSRIYWFIHDREEYGATCDEICEALDMLVQTASARLNDLARADLIARDGVRRKTRTGASAYVWTAVRKR